MGRGILKAGGFFLLAMPLFARADGAGLVELKFHDQSRDRPLAVKVWYPVAGSLQDASTSYDLAFRGHARWGAAYLAGSGARPLVMLSHGDRGSNADQSWLAEVLAAEGYIVAAVSHWLNTWKRNTPEATLKVWDRPKDISFTIDQLMAHELWGPRIDAQRIGAAGHSAGGYTALALAGAIYSPLLMSEYCEAQAGKRECDLGDGADLESIDFRQAGVSYRDPRIRAVVAMAPALGPGIERDSLARIDTPVLIVAATDDALLKFNLNAKTYAKGIPGAGLLPLSRGGHFVFMPECTFMGNVFTYFHRFDICGRRGNVVEARPKLHAQVAQAAKSFLDSRLSNENNMVRRSLAP